MPTSKKTRERSNKVYKQSLPAIFGLDSGSNHIESPKKISSLYSTYEELIFF